MTLVENQFIKRMEAEVARRRRIERIRAQPDLTTPDDVEWLVKQLDEKENELNKIGRVH